MKQLHERYVGEEEAARHLKIRESELDELVDRGELVSYKLGGKYIRFKKEDIERLKVKLVSKKDASLFDRIGDFLYFNSFYITAAIIIIVTLFVIFKL